MNPDLLYQKVGEFVVSFQWIEHRLREIGWLINDPQRKVWPPLDLREESNSQLLNKVEEIYVNFIKSSAITNKEDKITSFKKTISSLHEYRKYRNILLHSAYIEISSGDELLEIWRSNPKIKYKDGAAIFDKESLTPEKINEVMQSMAKDAFDLNIWYIQATHLAGTY